ncbi:cell division protein FtsQ/DivIB [Geobacillus sp. NFOSA3]|jgi:cell division protein FtsQ|uniref:Cell division protein DivIB n=2 Tax=Parageobacillus TaxID=1906945 RepID=A0A6G9J4D5_9BACL|nr:MULTISPECIES: cell division protein FtsQ/DivIB [Parageobacillus]NNU92117.1 cell division protein FtsQ/DivIB [Geobacillus sp. NFOSA3]OQO99825.1 cell division protein FtsQ [Geobacillus sp. 44C]MBB3867982.1 cell division protein FtsQ [Parageobacillus toebii NBRC 107807]MED4968676.1 cell division protein FtsQ/DivIB [Parageobacillus toebii]MED4988998.1 cell division protein FtsQ/DivIB [Parageobacillus toebii]
MALEKGKKIVVLEERVPKLKERRRQKANRRLIAYISFFFLLILCMIYFQSPLSYVRHIQVNGNHHLSAKQVIQLSGITKRTSFWKVKEDEIKRNVEKHPEVKSVSLEKHFPNTIIIHVKERRRIAYIYDQQTFFPLLENGYILKKHTSKTAPSDAPILINWKKGEDIQEIAGQLAQLSPSILNAISEIHYTPSDDNRYHITVYMNDGFEVSANVQNFADKMSLYPSIVQQLDPNVKGVIHLEVSNYFTAYKQPKKEDDNDKAER